MIPVFRKSSIRFAAGLCLGISLVAGPETARANDLSAGRRLYVEHCAACHGIKGDGHGPLEHELSKPAADLRLLSRKYGNPLPDDQIARFLDGRADVQAHGPRDMPVWGWEMWRNPEGKGHPEQVSEPVAQIVRYLQSLQNPASNAISNQKSLP